jgi:two-component system, sensor histidine kinase and response regulator
MALPTILYVDDDQENLRSFRRVFRKDYHILLAESGAQGLQLLRAHAPVPVIITDQRMPEMTGIEFLEQTRAISPDSIRMILTGFTDVQALIDAINTGRVYRYITKPWDDQELFVTLKRAVENYELKCHHDRLFVDVQQKNAELAQSFQDLQAAQAQLIQAEKLASIGRLASHIAHELRNPIQGIRMGLELLRQELAETEIQNHFREACQTAFTHIDQEITAANKIVQDLLEYARDMKFEFTATDVNSLIEGALFNLADKIAAAELTIDTHYGDLAELFADGIRLRQVILNLLNNAIEATAPGGQITITTLSTSDAVLTITIQDTGCGIDAENLARVFEPFFTTKEKGVGVGMAIVHRIIQAHQGTIELASTPDVGTTVTVKLPMTLATEAQ